MNNFFSQRIKLALVLAVSFAAVKIMAPQIFLADSPKISPMFISRLKQAPSYIASIPKTVGQLFNFSKKSTIDQIAIKAPPAGLIFNNISQKVSAAEDKQNNKIYLKIQPGTAYKIEEIEVNGIKKKIIKIYKE